MGGGGANARHNQDFYPTPEDVTTALMDFLKLDKSERIWEPACGELDMVNVMRSRGNEVVATDISHGQDFLSMEPVDCDWIITNPPFSLSEEFIRKCHEYNKPFAMLLKSQYWHAHKRAALFADITPTWVLPLTWRPDFLFKQHQKGSPLMDVMWCVWIPPYNKTTKYLPLSRRK